MAATSTLIFAIFNTESQAEKAVKALVKEEFSADNIHVLMRQPGAPGDVASATVRTKTLVGPGVAIGTTLGAIGGALVAVSGGFLAAGPLFALAQGVVTGGAAGSLAGTVGGLGYWHDVVEFPEHDLAHGAILVGVGLVAQGQTERARKALMAAGAERVQVRSLPEAMQTVSRA